MNYSLNDNEKPGGASKPRFTLGQIVATPAALAALTKHGCSASTLLDRHLTGDWGNVHPEDAQSNDKALVSGDRILSSYEIAAGIVIWVLTEGDRSSSTILLPSDY